MEDRNTLAWEALAYTDWLGAQVALESDPGSNSSPALTGL